MEEHYMTRFCATYHRSRLVRPLKCTEISIFCFVKYPMCQNCGVHKGVLFLTHIKYKNNKSSIHEFFQAGQQVIGLLPTHPRHQTSCGGTHQSAMYGIAISTQNSPS